MFWPPVIFLFGLHVAVCLVRKSIYVWRNRWVR